MNKKGMSLVQAFTQVQTARTNINPNIAFLRALILYDRHLVIAREQVLPGNESCASQEERQVALMKKIQANVLNALCELCYPTFDKNLVKKTIEQHITLDGGCELSAIEKQLYSFYG